MQFLGQRWFGPVAFLAALAITLFAVWPVPRWVYRDLHPVPDAPEYLAGAVSLATTGEHQIEIAGKQYPSRYPIGFSATLVPGLWLGIEPIRVPFVASAAAAVLLLLLLGCALRAWIDASVAGLAALLLATTTGFLAVARAPMSDLTATVWVTAGFLCCIAYLGRPRLWIGASGAALLGIAVMYRFANLCFATVVLVCWLAVRPRLLRPWRDAVVLGAAFVMMLIPLFLAQAQAFGYPLSSGYGYWLADRGHVSDAFRLEFLDENLRYLARELLQIEWRQLVAVSHGTGGYFGPAGFVLLVLCCARALRDPRARWFAAGVAAYVGAMLFYFFPDARFFVPLFPLAAGVVAWQTMWILREGGRRARAAVGLLLVLHVLGIPGSRSPADLPTLLAPPPHENAWRYELIMRLRLEPPGAALAEFNPPYAKALLGEAWVVAPALDEHDYQWNPARFRFGRRERDAFVQQVLSRQQPVYAVAEQDLPQVLMANPAPVGSTWETVVRTPPGGGIARLRRG